MAGGVSEAAFNRLLTALDADRDRAAAAYEQLRERTIGLLRWWGAAEPEELADATFDRVAHKLSTGAVVAEGSLGAYVRGVARLIFYEARRRPRVQSHEIALLSPAPSADVELLTCLDSCLTALSRQDRDVVLRYYADGKAADVRRRLAAELDLSMTALRIRAHRIRLQLEQCVLTCRGRS
jgi:DNA-directed RNA polymerase specialized sigma24 family protein